AQTNAPAVEKSTPRGVYALAGFTPYFTATDIRNFDARPRIGIVIGARAGYRPAELLGIDGSIEFRRAAGDGHVRDPATGEFANESTEVSLSAWRLGVNARLLPGGRDFRFIASLGLGVSIDSIAWDGPCPPGCPEKSGPDPFAQLELGAEYQHGPLL